LPAQASILKELPAGGYHNLEMLAEEVRATYFPDRAPLMIQWGKKIERKRRRSIRLGSYHRGTEVIRIHPLLDSREVPLYFIQSIIYHEYLHHVLGASHGARFQRHERRFRYYHEAKQWLGANLPLLLGRRTRTRPVVRTLRRRPKPLAVQMRLF
jgi:hypothetical protein